MHGKIINVRQIQGEAQNALAEALINGSKLVLALDDMPSADRIKEWREMYDPDLSNLINPHVYPLPTQVLRPKDLRTQDLMVKIGVLHPDEDEATLAERFTQIQFDQFEFLIWTKTKIKEREILKAGL